MKYLLAATCLAVSACGTTKAATAQKAMNTSLEEARVNYKNCVKSAMSVLPGKLAAHLYTPIAEQPEKFIDDTIIPSTSYKEIVDFNKSEYSCYAGNVRNIAGIDPNITQSIIAQYAEIINRVNSNLIARTTPIAAKEYNLALQGITDIRRQMLQQQVQAKSDEFAASQRAQSELLLRFLNTKGSNASPTYQIVQPYGRKDSSESYTKESCGFVNQYDSGLNTICNYQCLSGGYSETINAPGLCPLSIERK